MERDYRGRDKTGQWHYGDRVRHPNGAAFIVNYSERGGSPMWHQVDPATIGQDTGLRDRDGKEIYQGDILRFILKPMRPSGDDTTLTGVVEWSKEESRYLINCNTNGRHEGKFGMGFTAQCDNLGNIHDNPELLNDGSE